MLCPEILSHLDFAICAVAYDPPSRVDGQCDATARDSYQAKWIATRCEYHHTHIDAFHALFIIVHYELVAMVRAGMIPQDDDEEDCGGENEGLAGTPHDNIEAQEAAPCESGLCTQCNLTDAWAPDLWTRTDY